MDPDVVGVRVEVAVVAVGDDHLRPLGADDAHEPVDRLVERRVGEVVGPCALVSVSGIPLSW